MRLPESCSAHAVGHPNHGCQAAGIFLLFDSSMKLLMPNKSFLLTVTLLNSDQQEAQTESAQCPGLHLKGRLSLCPLDLVLG